MKALNRQYKIGKRSETNPVLIIQRLTDNVYHSGNEYSCSEVVRRTNSYECLPTRLSISHKRKHHILIRRVIITSHTIYDIVAILLCFLSIVQTRPNGGSPVSYWYNPCHHSNNQKYEFIRYSVTKDDMTRIKEQLNTSLGSVEESVKNFTTTIFGSSIKEFLKEWHGTGYSYVQSLHQGLITPRHLLYNSSDDILRNLEMKELSAVHEEFFILMKDYLKYYIRVAKAIEQMKHEIQENRIKYDQERLMLLNHIREDVRINLKQVLCEIYECVLKIDHDFVMNIIKEDETLDWKEDYSDEINRHLRDGFIYGDVVNTLQHILLFMKAYEKIWTGF